MEELQRQKADPEHDPGPPGHRHRLLLRPGAGPLRRRLRGAQGRGPRPARHQRRRQVDHPAGHRRPRHARPRRRAPRRPDRHLRLAREAGRDGHPPAPGRQGRLPADDRPREPRDGGLRLPQRQGGPGAAHRQGPRPVREPGRAPGPGRPARCRAASSRCSPSPACCCTSPRCCSSTSCPSASRRSWSRSCSQVVERLKGEGTTIVIVEQSLNVALAMADRAVFLEKGQVRFEGDGPGAARARRPRPGRVPRPRGRVTRCSPRPCSPASCSSTAW